MIIRGFSSGKRVFRIEDRADEKILWRTAGEVQHRSQGIFRSQRCRVVAFVEESAAPVHRIELVILESELQFTLMKDIVYRKFDIILERGPMAYIVQILLCIRILSGSFRLDNSLTIGQQNLGVAQIIPECLVIKLETSSEVRIWVRLLRGTSR